MGNMMVNHWNSGEKNSSHGWTKPQRDLARVPTINASPAGWVVSSRSIYFPKAGSPQLFTQISCFAVGMNDLLGVPDHIRCPSQVWLSRWFYCRIVVPMSGESAKRHRDGHLATASGRHDHRFFNPCDVGCPRDIVYILIWIYNMYMYTHIVEHTHIIVYIYIHIIEYIYIYIL